MLGKLLKYEIRATSRTFLPLYGLIMLLALINKIFLPLNKDYFRIPQAISMSVYVILIIALFVMTLVVTIQRFYRNLLGDEGYLSFTLPVKSHSHIDAKIVTTLMWLVLSLIVSLLSIFVMVVNTDVLSQIGSFFSQVSEVFRQNGAPSYFVLLEGIVLLILSAVEKIIEIYAAITIGNLTGKHKLLAGFGSYIGFGVIEQILASILVGASGERISNYFHSLHYSVNSIPLGPIALAILAIILFCAVFGIAYYILINWLLSRKLNLE
jgi:hypothetical protein